MKVLKWCWAKIKDYWPIAVAVVGGLVALLLLSPGSLQQKLVKTERAALQAKRRARQLEIENGRDKALAVIKEEHRETIQKMDKEQRDRVAHLERNPAELSAALLRIGRYDSD